MKHGKLKAVLVIIIGLLLGYVVATQLGGFLGIEFIAKDLPAEVTPDAVAPPSAQATEETPLNPVAAIVLPAGALQDDLYIRAADALADAVATRTGQRPQVVEAGSEPPAGRRIVVGTQTVPELASTQHEMGEVFVFTPFATAPGQQSLAVVGGSRLGDAYGIYRLTDELLTGMDEAALFGQQRMFMPAMSRRLVDLGGVGIPQDPARWDPANYSHHLRAFEDVFLPEAPYIDQAKFAEVQAQFADYVQRMIAYGNNGIVMPGLPGVRQLRQGRRWACDLSGRQRVPRPPPGAARGLQPAHRLRPRDGDGCLPEHRYAGPDAAAGGVSESAVRRAGH